MVKTTLTKPIDINDLKRLSPITVVKEYITFNRKTQEISKEVKSITSYKVNDAGEVFIKAKHVYDDEKWHKDWQTPRMVAEDVSYFITHSLAEHHTETKTMQTRFTVYSEPEAMKGYYNKKCKNSLEKLENSVRRMF